MRTVYIVILAATLLSAAPVAQAQPGGRRGPGGFRERPLSRQDSLKTLAGSWQLWTHGGVGWLGAPGDVRRRYAAGLDVGVSGDRRFGDRVALRARLDFDDLPSTQPDAVVLNGVAYATSVDYGHGWFGSALGGVAARPWSHFWLEGGAGAGYFRSGLGDAATYQNSGTGQALPQIGVSGWGPAWSAGARFEFQPGRRNRMLAEFKYSQMERGTTRLRFYSIRAGYRAF